MRRRPERRVAWPLAGAAIAACVAAPAAAQDASDPRAPGAAIEVDRLLAAIGERDLRIDLLAWRIAETPSGREAARLRLFGELAAVAGDWLAESDPQDRGPRLARIEAIAAAASSPREAEALRWEIAIHQGLVASEQAERWRTRSRFHPEHAMRSASEAEIRDRFGRSAASLEEGLARRDASRRETAERLRRASGIEADLLAERQLALATDSQRGRFLAAWAWLGLAMLDRDPAAAARAERLLQTMLDAGEDPAPVEVSMDRRVDPAFCRAIVGMAMARGLARSHEEGRRWLALLEVPIVPEEIAAAVPWWSVELAIAARQPEALAALLADAGDRLPRRGLERAAAAAIDGAVEDPRWISVAHAALASLLSRGAIEEVLLLTPAAVADPRAFLPQDDLAIAIARLHEGRAADEPRRGALALLAAATSLDLPDAAAAALAAEAIERALDAGVDGAMLAEAASSPRFASVGPPLRDRLAWLRLASLDRAVGEDRGQRWSGAAREYLAVSPQGEGATLVRLRLDGTRLAAREIADLAVASDGGAFAAPIAALARQLLRARLADPDASDRRASAEAMVRLQRIGGAASDAAAAAERCWDQAEALLALGDAASRTAAADLLLECEAAHEAAGAAGGGGIADRAASRRWRVRAELHLAEGELGLAMRSARQAGGETLPRWWGRRLAAAWRSSPQRRDLAEALLASIASDETDPELLAAASLAAEQAWTADPSSRHASRWLRHAERVAASGTSPEAIETLARAAASAEAWPSALEASRALLARLPAGSEAWLDAKRLQLAALAELDPARARAVLRQHRALRPQWRSQRHAEWFAALAERLGDAPP